MLRVRRCECRVRSSDGFAFLREVDFVCALRHHLRPNVERCPRRFAVRCCTLTLYLHQRPSRAQVYLRVRRRAHDRGQGFQGRRNTELHRVVLLRHEGRGREGTITTRRVLILNIDVASMQASGALCEAKIVQLCACGNSTCACLLTAVDVLPSMRSIA